MSICPLSIQTKGVCRSIGNRINQLNILGHILNIFTTLDFILFCFVLFFYFWLFLFNINRTILASPQTLGLVSIMAGGEWSGINFTIARVANQIIASLSLSLSL